ncbi:hypothetical protein PLAN_40708 [Planktothrix rubescens CCAP 1459/22]|uniref:Uncharacterized protein n=1 Tax=Planktothrix rubescens CCAP 1459/22 TaxID=329571 RepID=A0A6J7ZN95_PLARU|nr:hypothetical protein PLAN_40708 [Planktothrix rubescens NIVA-CYA 18]
MCGDPLTQPFQGLPKVLLAVCSANIVNKSNYQRFFFIPQVRCLL